MSCPLGSRAALTPVSRRQLQVLQLVARSIDERGFPPSIREILIGLGLRPGSRQTVHEHIDRLAAKGMIIRHPRVARGLTLTGPGRELVARAAAGETTHGVSQ